MSAEPVRSGRATGPRSAAGKRRSAQNARRHGLTAATSDRLALESQVAAWRSDPDGAALGVERLLHLAEATQRCAHVRSHQVRLMDAMEHATGQDNSALGTGLSECALQQLKLVMRYRADAAVAQRKALREAIDALETRKQEGTRHARAGTQTNHAS